MGGIKTGLTVLPLFPQPSRPILGCLLPTNSTDSSSSIFGVNEMKQGTATEITPAPRVSAPTPGAQHRYTCTHLPGPRPLSQAVYAAFPIQRVPAMNPVQKEIRAPSYTRSVKPGFTALYQPSSSRRKNAHKYLRYTQAGHLWLEMESIINCGIRYRKASPDLNPLNQISHPIVKRHCDQQYFSRKTALLLGPGNTAVVSSRKSVSVLEDATA